MLDLAKQKPETKMNGVVGRMGRKIPKIPTPKLRLPALIKRGFRRVLFAGNFFIFHNIVEYSLILNNHHIESSAPSASSLLKRGGWCMPCPFREGYIRVTEETVRQAAKAVPDIVLGYSEPEYPVDFERLITVRGWRDSFSSRLLIFINVHLNIG